MLIVRRIKLHIFQKCVQFLKIFPRNRSAVFFILNLQSLRRERQTNYYKQNIFMNILSIVFIAMGLAMDCFAISISKGICTGKFYFRYAFRIALLFGLFQGLMPLIGYFVANNFAEQITRFDHWIAFVLLGFIGTKMIVEAFKKKEECDEHESIKKHFQWKILLSLAVATSIDALATGIIFVPFPELIWVAVIIIAVASFIFSFAGVIIGVRFGKRFHLKVEALGGIILIIIGLKILIEHLFF